MRITDFLGKLLGRVKIGSCETVVIDIPAVIYYKELALHTAYSYIGNAISMCEMRVFANNKPVKNEDYFILNVSPNKNENASLFWHKVIRKMVRDHSGALVVEINGELHCAESFNVMAERPVLGNLYDGVVLEGGLELKKIFRAEEVYLFRMEDESVKALIDGLYTDYGKLLESAARSFRDTNGRKFKFKVQGSKSGDDEFNQEFNEVISKNIKAYMENEYATYVEYEGEELEEQSDKKDAKSVDDVVKLRKDIFEIVGQAFKIPKALMDGNVTSVKDVCDVFITFAVDPVADTITKVLNKRATKHEYSRGNYYKCYTGKIKHRDLFDAASDADKLISSSIMNPDEAREELDLIPTGEDWAKRHYLTKNYNRVEDITNPIVEEVKE